jgi:hypothetical protein
MSVSSIHNLVDLGASYKEDFLTIYDKTKSVDKVKTAFENIQPFFKVLIDNDLTDKTIDELNDLYHNIRNRIREPIRTTKPQDRPQLLGIWNGVPTPIWGNALCGMFDAGVCLGFVLGTHTVIPTIGADAFLTYVFQGNSLSIGLAGFTMAVTAFQLILGFIGVLLATPLIMLGPYFLSGLAVVYFGAGL